MRIRVCVSSSYKSKFAPLSVLLKIPKASTELTMCKGASGSSVPIPTLDLNSTLLINVDIPATDTPAPVTCTPLLAVISPIASTFVTSSYVRVPAIDTFPLNDALPVTSSNDPLNVKLLSLLKHQMYLQ